MPDERLMYEVQATWRDNATQGIREFQQQLATTTKNTVDWMATTRDAIPIAGQLQQRWNEVALAMRNVAPSIAQTMTNLTSLHGVIQLGARLITDRITATNKAAESQAQWNISIRSMTMDAFEAELASANRSLEEFTVRSESFLGRLVNAWTDAKKKFQEGQTTREQFQAAQQQFNEAFTLRELPQLQIRDQLEMLAIQRRMAEAKRDASRTEQEAAQHERERVLIMRQQRELQLELERIELRRQIAASQAMGQTARAEYYQGRLARVDQAGVAAQQIEDLERQPRRGTVTGTGTVSFREGRQLIAPAVAALAPEFAGPVFQGAQALRLGGFVAASGAMGAGIALGAIGVGVTALAAYMNAANEAAQAQAALNLAVRSFDVSGLHSQLRSLHGDLELIDVRAESITGHFVNMSAAFYKFLTGMPTERELFVQRAAALSAIFAETEGAAATARANQAIIGGQQAGVGAQLEEARFRRGLAVSPGAIAGAVGVERGLMQRQTELEVQSLNEQLRELEAQRRSRLKPIEDLIRRFENIPGGDMGERAGQMSRDIEARLRWEMRTGFRDPALPRLREEQQTMARAARAGGLEQLRTSAEEEFEGRRQQLIMQRAAVEERGATARRGLDIELQLGNLQRIQEGLQSIISARTLLSQGTIEGARYERGRAIIPQDIERAGAIERAEIVQTLDLESWTLRNQLTQLDEERKLRGSEPYGRREALETQLDALARRRLNVLQQFDDRLQAERQAMIEAIRVREQQGELLLDSALYGAVSPLAQQQAEEYGQRIMAGQELQRTYNLPAIMEQLQGRIPEALRERLGRAAPAIAPMEISQIQREMDFRAQQEQYRLAGRDREIQARQEQFQALYQMGQITQPEMSRAEIAGMAEQVDVLTDRIRELNRQRDALADTSQNQAQREALVEETRKTTAEIERLYRDMIVSIKEVGDQEDPFAGVIKGLQDVASGAEQWGTRMRSIVQGTASDLGGFMSNSFFTVVDEGFKGLGPLAEQAGRAIVTRFLSAFAEAQLSDLAKMFLGQGAARGFPTLTSIAPSGAADGGAPTTGGILPAAAAIAPFVSSGPIAHPAEPSRPTGVSVPAAVPAVPAEPVEIPEPVAIPAEPAEPVEIPEPVALPAPPIGVVQLPHLLAIPADPLAPIDIPEPIALPSGPLLPIEIPEPIAIPSDPLVPIEIPAPIALPAGPLLQVEVPEPIALPAEPVDLTAMPSVATVAPPLLPEFVALSPAPTQTPLGLAGQIGQLARILTGGLVGGQRQPIAVPPDLISALVLPGAAVPGAQAVSGPMEPMGQGFAFPDVSQYSFGLGRVTAPQVGTPVVPRAPATGFSGFVEGLGTSVRGFLGTPISQFFGGGTSAAAQARQLQSMDAFATFDEMGTAMPSQTPGFQSMTRFGEFGEITPSVSAAGAGSGFDLTAALQSLTVGQGLGLALSSVTFGVGLYSAYQSGSPLAGTITGGLSGAALGGQLAATGLVPVASSTAGAIGAGVGAAAGLALALAGRAKTKQEKRTAINRTRRMGAYATGAARLVRRLAQGLDEAVDRANEEVQNAAKNATLAKPVAVLDEYLRTHVVGDLGDPGYTMTNGWKTFGGTMKGITGEIQYGQAIAFKDPLPKGWGIRPGGRVIDPDPRFDVILHEADLGAGTPPTEFWGYADAGDVVTVLAEYVRVRERFQEMQDRLDLEAAGDRLTAAAEAADEHVAAMAKLAYGQPRAAAIFFESLRGGQVAGLPLGGVIRKLAQLNLAGRFGQDWPVDAELQGLADDERLGPAVDVPDSFIAADNLGRLRSIVEGARRGREQLDEADADLRAQFQEIGEKAPIAYDERSTVGGVTRRTYLPFQARPGGPADDVYEAPRGQQFLVSGQQLGSLGLTDDQVSDLIKHIREVAGRRGMVMDLGSDDFMMTGLG